MKKVIYPMSMLNEVVGNDEKVAREVKETFDFNRNEPYFHYEEGVMLESLDETLADFAVREMGMSFYAERMPKAA